MKEDEECQETQEEFRDLKQKFVSLSQNYEKLQREVHEQALQTKSLVQKVVNPDPTMNKVGVVPAPPDQQYDVAPQMRQPLIWENRNESHDIKHYYNPDKTPTPQNYISEQKQVYKQLANATSLDKALNNVTTLVTINPAHPTGLVPPPPDAYYDNVW